MAPGGLQRPVGEGKTPTDPYERKRTFAGRRAAPFPFTIQAPFRLT
jgi:hypothetical protein